MSRDTNISVDALRLIAKGHKYKAMIAVGVREDGTVDVVSYGESKEDCRVIGDYAQNQFGSHIPYVPFSTWFGWGNNGVPLKMAAGAYEDLQPSLRAYVDANTHPDAEDI